MKKNFYALRGCPPRSSVSSRRLPPIGSCCRTSHCAVLMLSIHSRNMIRCSLNDEQTPSLHRNFQFLSWRKENHNGWLAAS